MSPERWRLFRVSGMTLVEVLIGLIVFSSLVLTLLGFGRFLMLSSALAVRRDLAGIRGQRVLSYLEFRALHAGLGLFACRDRGGLQRALGRGFPDCPPIASWPDDARPVRVYEEKHSGSFLYPVDPVDGVSRGSSLALLHGRPSGVFLATPNMDYKVLSPGQELTLDIIEGKAEVLQDYFKFSSEWDLRGWVGLSGLGMPLSLRELSRSDKTVTLRLSPSVLDPAVLPPVHELIILRCDRFRVNEETFYVQSMFERWYPPAFQPREDGILAFWCEWREEERILNLWVLASGGAAVFPPASRPAAWPACAPWREDFSRHELVVSRASWKLENL